MEWEKHPKDEQQEDELQLQPHQDPQQQTLEGPPPMGADSGGEEAAPFIKAMTDEQMEILQKQIAAYATICEQLENLHRSLTSSHSDIPNTDYMLRNIGNPYCTPLMMTSSHNHHSQYYYGQPKIPRRQRWNPTPEQLQILEQIFDQGNEAPSKERIKNITAELAKHGQIAETNVYNWFQNRRARFKKKQMMSAISESEGEMVSETSSKSIGENPKSSEQLVTSGDQTYSKAVSMCVDHEDTKQQQPTMFPDEDSLTATGAGGGGGSDGSYGHMARRTLSSKSELDYLAVNSESYYTYFQAENYESIE